MHKELRPSNLRLLIAIGAVFIAFPAHAHGEEVLVSIFAQVASVIAVVLALFAVRAFRSYWIPGLLGCISGTVLSEWATGDMPYRQNAALITAICAGAPIVFTALSVLAAACWAMRRVSGRGHR